MNMNDKLEDWRKQIDALDSELLHVLAKRIDIVREIGKYKKAQGIPPLDQKRWRAVLESQISKAELLNLSKDFIKKLYNLIHEYSLEIEANNK